MTDITELNKVELLKALWNNQNPPAFFGHGPGPTFNPSDAQKALENGYIDYFCGRAIKADLSGSTVSFKSYDRDSKFSGSDVVNSLRKGFLDSSYGGCVFRPYGSPMIGDDVETIMCGTCGYLKKQH